MTGLSLHGSSHQKPHAWHKLRPELTWDTASTKRPRAPHKWLAALRSHPSAHQRGSSGSGLLAAQPLTAQASTNCRSVLTPTRWPQARQTQRLILAHMVKRLQNEHLVAWLTKHPNSTNAPADSAGTRALLQCPAPWGHPPHNSLSHMTVGEQQLNKGQGHSVNNGLTSGQGLERQLSSRQQCLQVPLFLH